MAIEEIQSTEIPSVPQSLEDLARWTEDWSRDHFDDLKKLDTLLSLISGGFVEIPADPTVPGADGNWRWYNDGTDLILQRKVADVWTDTGIKFLNTGETKTLAGRIVNLTEDKDATIVIAATDDHVSMQYSATGISAALLPPITTSNDGQEFHVKDADYNASVNNITVNTTGADTIEGELDGLMTLDGECWTMIANNTTKNWEVQ